MKGLEPNKDRVPWGELRMQKRIPWGAGRNPGCPLLLCNSPRSTRARHGWRSFARRER